MLLVAVFDEEEDAQAGAEALRDLHDEGTVSLYAFALVMRELRGKGLSIREPFGRDVVAAAPAAGAAVGALVSLIGGPATAAMRTVGSGLVEAVRDLVEAGLDPAFLEQIARRLRPGTAGLVAEAEEDGLLPLEARLLSLGGHVLRHENERTKPEEFVMRDIIALRRGLAELRKEGEGAKHAAVAKTVLRSRQAELRRALERARLLARALRREAVAKVAVLRSQAAHMQGEARAAVEDRAGRVRAALEARASRLDQFVEDAAALIRHGGGRQQRDA
jgi:uncharacterized membrane protein